MMPESEPPAGPQLEPEPQPEPQLEPEPEPEPHGQTPPLPEVPRQRVELHAELIPTVLEARLRWRQRFLDHQRQRLREEQLAKEAQRRHAEREAAANVAAIELLQQIEDEEAEHDAQKFQHCAHRRRV